MNILILISTLKMGGAEKQAVIDANMLAENNNVSFLCFVEGELKDLLSNKVNLIIIKKQGYLKTARKIREIIKSRRVELIHAHLYAPMIIASLAVRRLKIPVIWNFHSHAFNAHLLHRLMHMLASRLSTVKKIIFPAGLLQLYYQKTHPLFPRKKFMILYNSATLSGCKNNNNTKEGKKIIGYAGRIIPLKRLEYLIETAKFLRTKNYENFIFWIIGDGESLNKLEEQIVEAGLENNFKLWGFHQDLTSFYHQMDLFVMPSREEVLSLSLIDAGMSGIAAVAFDVGSNSEIIRHQKTGFIVENLGDFNKRVYQLLVEDKLRVELGKSSAAFCLKTFSSDIRKKKLISTYQELVNV